MTTRRIFRLEILRQVLLADRDQFLFGDGGDAAVNLVLVPHPPGYAAQLGLADAVFSFKAQMVVDPKGHAVHA